MLLVKNKVDPSNSRHSVATPHSPDAVGTFQDCYSIRNFPGGEGLSVKLTGDMAGKPDGPAHRSLPGRPDKP